MTLLNLFKLLHCRVELLKHIRRATVQRDLHENQQGRIQIMRVKQCGIAMNETLALETAHAF